MTDDAPKPDPRAVEKLGQAILPGMRHAVGYVPEDRRPWRDARGRQVDSPAFRAQFFGKIIPPVTEPDGSDVRADDYQVLRTATGDLIVVDWATPMSSNPLDRGRELDSGMTRPILGRTVYRTRQGIVRAKNAMNALARRRRDEKSGLPLDPAVVRDARKKEIKRGELSLCRFARGSYKGRYCIVDDNVVFYERGHLELLTASASMKAAIAAFQARAHAHQHSEPPRAASVARATGAPIAFEVPSGFGFGARSARSDSNEKLNSRSPAWRTSVDLYARTGKWCRTAELVWGDDFPAALVSEARAARAVHLERHEQLERMVDGDGDGDGAGDGASDASALVSEKDGEPLALDKMAENKRK